jgi:hypothetical protein
LSLALSAVIGLVGSVARAESITMTISGPGGSILVDTFITGGADSQHYGNVLLNGAGSLNAALAAAGYAYTFTALGGGSNWFGTTAQGNMTLSGGIQIAAGTGGFTTLTITETEDGFTLPTGPAGVLKSASTATFTNQVAGAGHTAESQFTGGPPPGTVSAGPYDVLATAAGGAPGPDHEGNGASAALAPVATPYTLTNIITFTLTPSGTLDVSDSFGLTATVQTVPEPASIVMFLMGMPLPLVVVGLLRRRRRGLVAG